MRIAMVSEHASPLAALGGAGRGRTERARGRAGAGAGAVGATRSTSTRGATTRRLPERVPLAAGVTVVHVPAGPPRPVPKDALLPHMDDFADWLAG